jgi:hypothetical protein
MKHALKNRALFLRMPLVALFVALSVVSWGTKYKTSLYPEPAKKPHPVAFAKLLSEKERPSADEKAAAEFSFAACASTPVSSSPWFIAPSLPTVSPQLDQTASRAVPPPLPKGSNYYFFYRPPPAPLA